MDESFTIQISSNLVNKLVRDGMAPKKRPKKFKPKAPPKHPTEPNSTLAEPRSGSSAVWSPQTPMFLPMPVTVSPTPSPLPSPPTSAALAELEAIRMVIKESEAVMKKLEEKETNMTQELTQRAKEFRDKEFKLPYQKSMPCEAEREACRECYKENMKHPLKCAQVVRSFEDCARRARRQQQQVVTSEP